MKNSVLLVLALGISFGGPTTLQAQLLIGGSLNNGNFDQTQPVEIVPGFFLAKPAVWINEGFRAISGPYEDDLSSEPWAGPAPTPVTADGSGLPHPDGCGGPDCGVFFKPFSGNVNDGAATSHLYQDHPAVPGLTYILTGWAGAEANALMAKAEIAVEFLDAGSSILPGGDVVDLLPTLYVPNNEPFNYKLYTASAVAPAGAATVRARISMIDALANPLGGGQAFVVDDFTFVAIPEPSSMVLASMSLIGMLRLRRRGW